MLFRAGTAGDDRTRLAPPPRAGPRWSAKVGAPPLRRAPRCAAALCACRHVLSVRQGPRRTGRLRTARGGAGRRSSPRRRATTPSRSRVGESSTSRCENAPRIHILKPLKPPGLPCPGALAADALPARPSARGPLQLSSPAPRRTRGRSYPRNALVVRASLDLLEEELAEEAAVLRANGASEEVRARVPAGPGHSSRPGELPCCGSCGSWGRTRPM
jgi:hypothetical protein